MKYKISDNILNVTTKCPNNFGCLTEPDKYICKIDKIVGEDILFVKHGNPHYYCPYAVTFGHSLVCTCPTRLEIYRKYSR